MYDAKALREQKGTLGKQAEDILSKASSEKRSMDNEELSKFNEIHDEIDGLNSQIAAIEKQDKLNQDLSGAAFQKRDDDDDVEKKVEITAEDRSDALRGWLLAGGDQPVAEKYQNAAKKCGVNLSQRSLEFNIGKRNKFEQRAQSVGTATAGGHFVPEDFTRSLETALLHFGGMREVATEIVTADGGDKPFPTLNDTSNSGRLLTENTQVTNTDITVSQIVLNAYKYSSDQVLVSVELMQDDAFDTDSWVGAALGERLGRITNQHFTTGTGSSQPNGIVTAATSGVTAAATDAVTWQELLDLVHSVDPAYRGNGRFMFSDNTLRELRQLADGDDRPLWQPGLIDGVADSILGVPYTVNQDVADMATTAKPILYGALDKYLIRTVTGVQMLRLDERFADYHQVSFLAFLRTDGALLNAGTNPVKFITMA
jgi:HK97 family phage major capsid protein